MKKKRKALSLILVIALMSTLISIAPATISSAAVDFNAMPIPTIDTTKNGYNIARTMYLLESSTAEKPNTVRIAVTGQSISDSNNAWVPNLINWLRGKYPTANIIFQNFAIGGFSTQTLYKRVPNDMASFFPDLVLLYDYGDHTLYDRMVKYIRQIIGAEVMMQTEHYTGFNDWSNQMSYTLLPQIATKYGAELCQIRTPWESYIKQNGLSEQVLLVDGTHLNSDGQAFMLGLMKQFFVYRASNAETVIANQTVNVQQSDWINGKLTIPFKGTRAEVISGTGTQYSTDVQVDSKAPSTYKENYIRSAEANGMSATIMGIINFNSVPLEQKWTIEVTSYTNTNTFGVKASGSISGDEGTSVANVLNGTHIKLDYESFIWNYTPPTVGKKYTFSSILNGCDTYNGLNKVLFSGMPNANHSLVLAASNPLNIPDIKAIRFYDVSALVVAPIATPTPINILSMKMSKPIAFLNVPQALKLTYTYLPLTANKNVTWKSSNNKVATVSVTGNVTSIAPGRATITASAMYGDAIATCIVIVNQPVKSVKLNKVSNVIIKGKTFKLIATINPSNASNKKVTWKSVNRQVATVSTTGVVKGIKKGSTYIYVYSVDGNKSAKCKVTVG